MTREFKMKNMFKFILFLIISFHCIYVFAKEETSYKTLLWQFQNNPTEELVKQLVDILDNQKVSSEEGNKILKALMTPVVAKRDAYIIGTDAHIRIKHPFRLVFSNMYCERSKKLAIGNNYVSESSYRGEYVLGKKVDSFVESVDSGFSPDTPSVLKIRVELEYGIIPYRKGVNQADDENTDKPVYKCSFKIPVKLNFVEEKNVKPILLFSNPSIDEKVKSSFSIKTNDIPWSLISFTSKKEVICNTKIIYSNLPAAMGFNISLIDNNGREYLLTKTRWEGFTAAKGTSGEVSITLGRYSNIDSLIR